MRTYDFIIKILSIIVIFLVILLLKRLTGASLVGMIKRVKVLWNKFISSNSSKFNQLNRKNFNVKSKQEKDESLYFKAYVLIQDMITDMGWNRNRRMNVEYLMLILCIGALVIELFISSVITQPAIRTLMFFVIIYWALIIIYISSRKRSKKRNSAIREALNLICQNIEPNFSETVNKIVNLVDDSIKIYFITYQEEITNQNLSYEHALDNLEKKLGRQSHEVLHKVRILSKTGKKGMDDAFKDDLEIHALEREMEIESEREIYNGQILLKIFISMFLTTVVISCISFEGCAIIYKSTMGQCILLFLSIFIGAVMTLVEIINSKRYE